MVEKYTLKCDVRDEKIALILPLSHFSSQRTHMYTYFLSSSHLKILGAVRCVVCTPLS